MGVGIGIFHVFNVTIVTYSTFVNRVHSFTMNNNNVQDIHSALIDVLTEQRKGLNLSHERLAALAGVHRTAISHIENRRRHPTLIICLKLANAMNLSFADLMKKAEARIAKTHD